MSAFVDRIVQLCTEEHERFGRGRLKEYDTAVYRRVGDYWDELAKIEKYQRWRGYNGRTDSDLQLDDDDNVTGVISNRNQPWSAAFISWIAKAAGAGDRFLYSPSHSRYIVAALKAAAQPDSPAHFVARRHTAYAPKLGDLIACERRELEDATFDTYIDFVSAERYEAHCDFVVALDMAERKAITIGGNVSHSVRKKVWPLNAQGRIGDHDPHSPTAGVICIIENRL